VPYVDILRGLKALFLERPEAVDVGALLAARAPGLGAEERLVLASLPDERVAVYVGLLRANQATMLDFVAPSTVEVAAAFGGVSREEFARATLVDTPRRSSRMRELSERVLDHLAGAGRAIATNCPAIVDLARLERAQTSAFYAPDLDDALSPPAFAELAAAATVDEMLALEFVVAPSVRIVALERDVLAWRARRHETGTWDPPPPRLAAPLEVLVARDPVSLQPESHVLPRDLLALVRPSEGPRSTLESLAERWIEASGVSPDDAEAAPRFFEQAADWTRHGVIAVFAPSKLDVDGTQGRP